MSVDRQTLLDTLDDRLDAEDVRQVCFDLGLDWDNLVGEETKRGKLRALIQYHERRGRQPAQLARVAARRPDVAEAEGVAGALPGASSAAPRREWTAGGEDWLDFVAVAASLVAVLRLGQGATDWTVALLLLAALAGGLRSMAVQRSTLWRETRWRLAARAVLVGVPLVLLAGLLGYHLFLRRQVLVYVVSLPLLGVALRVAYRLYRQVWRPTE